MRGMFTCGVIDVFMKNGITFDGVIGVLAGVAFVIARSLSVDWPS